MTHCLDCSCWLCRAGREADLRKRVDRNNWMHWLAANAPKMPTLTSELGKGFDYRKYEIARDEEGEYAGICWECGEAVNDGSDLCGTCEAEQRQVMCDMRAEEHRINAPDAQRINSRKDG
jgi:hypothetical protein